MIEEFSHTILHGESIAKKLQPRAVPARPLSVRAVQTPINPPVTPLQKQYDPSKIYKNPLPIKRPQLALQKSVEKKVSSPSDKKKILIKPQQQQNVQVNDKSNVFVYYFLIMKFILCYFCDFFDKRSSPDQRKRPQELKEEFLHPKKQLDNLIEKQKVIKKFFNSSNLLCKTKFNVHIPRFENLLSKTHS